ncbi:MAG: hypothetical protein GY820_17880 [Gammaproteobacteria bacterium]|nr:hypothetical protein [Gammaproteobacteria bacterium]
MLKLVLLLGLFSIVSQNVRYVVNRVEAMWERGKTQSVEERVQFDTQYNEAQNLSLKERIKKEGVVRFSDDEQIAILCFSTACFGFLCILLISKKKKKVLLFGAKAIPVLFCVCLIFYALRLYQENKRARSMMLGVPTVEARDYHNQGDYRTANRDNKPQPRHQPYRGRRHF